ncbi:hypothetical protein F4782DRAFT_552203 [Xylaria castorea]|nr:hypothetical protein F4782DRAFT_552203 [Xylaria castorea]
MPLEIPATLNHYVQGFNTYFELEPTSATYSSSTKKPTKTTHVTTESTSYSTVTRTCDGAVYPQACYHYSSVAQRSTYSRVTCSNQDHSNNLRPLTQSYNNGHKNKVWFSYIAKSYTNPNNKRKGINCQRDEWPPAHFQQGRPDGWIRLLPGDQNGPAANNKNGGWRGICKFPPQKQVKEEGGPIIDYGAYYLLTSYTSTIVTLNVLSYTWNNVNPPASDRYGLTANACRPSVLTTDVGFALQTNDPWYGIWPKDYNSDPGSKTKGMSKPTWKKAKRFDFVEGVMVVDEGNSTRLAADEEIEMELGYTRCKSGDCKEELEILRKQQAQASMPTVLPDSQPAVETIVTAVAYTTIGGRPAPTAYASQPTGA